MTWQFIVLWLVAALHPLFRYWILPYPPIDSAGKPQPQPWKIFDSAGKPQPVPWKILVPGFLAIAGGLAGGWMFYSTWISREKISGLEAASTALGAYLGATLVLGIYRLTVESGTPRSSQD